MNISKISEQNTEMRTDVIKLCWTISKVLDGCDIIKENELQEMERHEMTIRINHLVFQVAKEVRKILEKAENLITDMK